MLSRITGACGSISTCLKKAVVKANEAIDIPYVTVLIFAANFYFYLLHVGYPVTWDTIFSKAIVLQMFSHSGIGHIMSNSLFLILVGPGCERLLGHLSFLIMYLFCGIAAAYGFLMFYPNESLLGASGAICGLMAVYPMVQKSLSETLIACFPITHYFYINFQNALAIEAGIAFSRTAFLAHVAGAVAGLALFGYLVQYAKKSRSN